MESTKKAFSFKTQVKAESSGSRFVPSKAIKTDKAASVTLITDDTFNRLKQERDLYEQYKLAGTSNEIHLDLSNLTATDLPFSLIMVKPHQTYSIQKDLSLPYFGYQILGVIRLPDTYPKGRPDIMFSPVLPHINVNSAGRLCFGSTTIGTVPTLTGLLQCAELILCNPNWENREPSSMIADYTDGTNPKAGVNEAVKALMVSQGFKKIY